VRTRRLKRDRADCTGLAERSVFLRFDASSSCKPGVLLAGTAHHLDGRELHISALGIGFFMPALAAAALVSSFILCIVTFETTPLTLTVCPT
jgi:hypothetical protein